MLYDTCKVVASSAWDLCTHIGVYGRNVSPRGGDLHCIRKCNEIKKMVQSKWTDFTIEKKFLVKKKKEKKVRRHTHTLVLVSMW